MGTDRHPDGTRERQSEPATGGCQRVYLVSTPGRQAREDIMRVLADRDNLTLADELDTAQIAELTEGCAGADLERILGRASEIADLQQGQDDAPLTQEHLEAALADYKPNRDPLLHEFFDLVSIRTCPFRSGIPWHTGGQGLNHPDTPDHVRRIPNEDGTIDVAELNTRINELEHQCQQIWG